MLVNNEDILNVLGKNIKKVRKEKGYTQDYVAEQINVSTDLLRSIENGRNIGSITTLLNICNFLQVSPNTLFAELLNFKEDTLDSSLLNLTHQLSKEDKNILKNKIEESNLLINATRAGMKENISLIEDKSFFRKDLIVSDCIYNPSKTKFLQIAEKEGCKIINGMGMLLYQGALAFEFWTNKQMPVDYIKEIIFK